ncbi:MAG: hypothetical protein WA991_07650 [Ornithinimicrobium sp.]
MRKTLMTISALIAVILALASTAAFALSGSQESLRVEVAEVGSRFVTDPDVVDADGIPARGNDFVTEGYVYQEGTLTCTDGVCDGVVYDADGVASPEFPDRVIGTWTCWGTHTEDAATTTSGAIVATTQQYDLGDALGERSIVTTGYERLDDVPIQRAITGGTGSPNISNGVATQMMGGLNNPDLTVGEAPVFGVTLFVDLESTD